MTWQPISTLPKDGTPVLLFADGDVGIGMCATDHFDGLELLSKHSAWLGQKPHYRGKSVWIGGRDMLEASHWMPLPEPPEA